MKIIYLGFNSFKLHKRGVENVIDFQSKACDFNRIYYIHWGLVTTAYKNNNYACVSINHCWYWPLILNLVLFKIKKKNKLIIHSHNSLFSLFSIYKTNILTVHDALYYQNKNAKHKFYILFIIFELLLYYKCLLVHFISTFTKEQSLFGNRKNFVIIPNTSHLEPLVKLPQLQQNKFIKKTVLIVRSIEERARFDLLLEVADRLQEKDYKFIIAGKGHLLYYFKKEIEKRKLNNIEMLGYINDIELIRLYSNCDIVLIIAEYGEGFGLPIIEGYLFNKPVIASNRCAIPEVIISKDYLFENSVDKIIYTLDTALKIENENYRMYYDSNFSNTIVFSKLRELYLSSFHK